MHGRETEMTDEASSYPFDKRVPDGDTRERLVCRDCGFIHYQNPTIVPDLFNHRFAIFYTDDQQPVAG